MGVPRGRPCADSSRQPNSHPTSDAGNWPPSSPSASYGIGNKLAGQNSARIFLESAPEGLEVPAETVLTVHNG